MGCGCNGGQTDWCPELVLPICRQCDYHGTLKFDDITFETCKAVSNGNDINSIIDKQSELRTIKGLTYSGCPRNKWPEKK